MSRLITSATIGNFLAAPNAFQAREAIQANPISITTSQAVTASIDNFYVVALTSGSVSFTDPAGSVVGDGYWVYVRGGSIVIGGNTYGPNSLVYRFRDSVGFTETVYAGAWGAVATALQSFFSSPTSANLAALLTDESGTGGGFVRATGATLTSPSLVGPVNLTSQDASAADRVMTRTLGDARYGDIIVSRLASASAPIQSQTVLQPTGCSVALPTGLWLISAQTHVENGDATAQFKFGATLTGGTFSSDRGRVAWAFGNTGSQSQDNASFLTATRTLGNGTRGFIVYDGLVSVQAGTTTLATQFAQNVSVATPTFCAANSFIIARRVG